LLRSFLHEILLKRNQTFNFDCQRQKKKAEKLGQIHGTRANDLDRSIPMQLRHAHPQTLPRTNDRPVQVFDRDHSGLLGLNPRQRGLMAGDYSLYRSQPGLSASQRSLNPSEVSFSPAKHHFRCGDIAGGASGDLLDGGQ
jgi:hypothetical protein